MRSQVEPGQRFGRWTVIAEAPERYHKQMLWICQCDCGTVRRVPSHSLVAGRSQSCGCIPSEKNKARALNLRGQRFGRLVVQERSEDGKWCCLCDCGNMTMAEARFLRIGKVASCGCLRRDRIASMVDDRVVGQVARKAARVDGTDLAEIKPDRRINKNSRTGVRGVSLTQDGRYRATIVLRRVQYELGRYGTLEEAANARAEAEERLYKPIIEAHKKPVKLMVDGIR